jgi:hypothetical protein
MTASKPKQPSLAEEIGKVAFVLSIPDFTLSGVIVWLQGLARPGVVFEGLTMVSVFLATFPLTVAVAALVLLHARGGLNPYSACATIIISALMADVLHLGGLIPGPVSPAFHSGQGYLFDFAVGVLVVYWNGYGWLLFIKSCFLGLVVGRKISTGRAL